MGETISSNTRIGRWRLLDLIGRGAFGSTWRASGEQGEIVALKILQEMPGNELRALSRVCHPGIVGVLDGGGEPCPFVVMEHATGRTLSSYVKEGRLTEPDCLAIAAILFDALAALHHVGIYHGDLKPDNLLVSSTRPASVKLVDFGMAGTSTGGTLAYAAPERTQGKPSSPASDVYAAGLMLWEMLHGKIPWGDLDIHKNIQNRRKLVPVPTQGSPWVRELLKNLLQVDPAARPEAATVADLLAAHGVPLPELDPALLRRRTRTVHVHRPHVETAVGTWLSQGGVLALVGTSGSGRTHTLDRVVTELQALGRPWVRLMAGTLPWVAIEQALVDPLLIGKAVTLPAIGDTEERAQLAARLLIGRSASRLAVIVDDVGELDPGSSRVVANLATTGVCSVLVSGSSAPPWVSRVCDLGPLDWGQLQDLISGVLGSGGLPEGLLQRIVESSGGVPGPAVGLLIQAVKNRVLVMRAYRWLLVGSAFDEMVIESGAESSLDQPLGPQARLVGAILAIHELPLPIPSLAKLSGTRDGQVEVALQELVAAGLVRVEARIARCIGRSARKLLAEVEEAPEIHRNLVSHLRGQLEVPYARLGWHIVGARDAALAAELGPESIAAAIQQDAGVASRLAEALWVLAPLPDLVVPRIQALVGAGHVEEARLFGESLIEHQPRILQDVPVLVALARIQQDIRGNTEGALALLDEARQVLGDVAPPAEWYLARATSCLAAERFDEAIEVAEMVAKGPPRATSAALDEWLAARRLWAQALNRKGARAAALALLDEIPQDLGRGRPSRALLDATRGLLLQAQGRIREAAEVYSIAAAIDAGLTSLQRARLLNNIAACKYQSWDRAGALASWEEALLLFERLEATVEQVRVQNNLCLGYQEQGRWERARQSGEWAVQNARKLGIPELEAMALGNLGDLCMLRGSLQEASACFRRADQLAERNGLTGEKVELACRWAELAVRGNTTDILALGRRAEQTALDAGEQVLACRAAGYVVVGLSRAGKHQEVANLIEVTSRMLLELGATAELATFRLWAAEALLTLGKTNEALAIASSVFSFAEEVHHPQLRVRAEDIRKRVRKGAGPVRTQVRISRILELAVALTRIRDLNTLLERIADASMEFLRAERAFVLSVEGGKPVLKTARTAPGVQTGSPSRAIVAATIYEGREVIRENILPNDAIRKGSVNVMNLRMVVSMPLRDGAKVIGVIYVDSRQEGDQETAESVDLMRALASFASVALANTKHLEETNGRAEKAQEIAHDMRRPVANMMTVAASLLATEDLQPPVEQGLRDILSEGERAVAMVRNLFVNQPHQHVDLDLSGLVREFCALYERQASSRGLRFNLQVAEGLWTRGERDELHRVLANLIGNALRYGPPGSTLHVDLEEVEGQLWLAIRDEGPGIPAELLPKVFERGARAEDGSEGYGLGLAIARNIILEHGGSILAENAPEGGARFTLRLPRVDSPRS